jgi:hypothetical protein
VTPAAALAAAAPPQPPAVRIGLSEVVLRTLRCQRLCGWYTRLLRQAGGAAAANR